MAPSNRPLMSGHFFWMIAAGFVAFYFAIQSSPFQEAALSLIPQESPITLQRNEIPVIEKEAEQKNSLPPFHQNLTTQIERGDNLFDLLKRNGIPAVQIHELVAAARPVRNLGHLQQGQIFMVDYDERDGKIYRFETDLKESKLIVERQQEEMSAREEPFDFELRHTVVSGTINDSLFLAADEAGLPAPLIMTLADIFACDVDFHADIQSDDFFIVLFEEKYLEGRLAQTGRILAAGIENKGKPYWAFYYDGDKNRGGYYDEEGKSLRKAFLKSPLKFARISSRFTNRRFHPVLKIYRPHLGVDYAAPKGTPIRAVADGTILFAGWKGGYGRYIKIRHNNTYSSTYGHMNGFTKGVQRGKHVRQGDVIGYVGATGMATGPHLDFRLMKNDKFINPLSVNYADGDPINKKDMADFRSQVKQCLIEMNEQSSPLPSPSIQMVSSQLSQVSL